MLAVCPASSPARRACIDACGLAPGVTEHRARRLEIFRMLFEIRCCPKMPKLMRRHGNADMPHDCIGDLSSYGGLFLSAAPLCNEERPIHVGAQARQYVTAIPSNAAGNLVRDLTDEILFALSVPRGDVSEELASRTIWFAEVILPGQTAHVLWPK